ncbi:MAG: helix-turn-helix domain-containing protein [Candidatus Woesearchaeota archaeon]|nr:helix-turn-helix domain-containing protein [Candidatus Woesearchaeota archaeon]
MLQLESIQQAGLTEGEAKVYLALLKLGSSTSGPIIEESGVANSIVYRILNSLIEKGLASYIVKEKTKYFKAADPKKIIDFIEQKKELLDENKKSIESMLPQLLAMSSQIDETNVQIFEGFNGFLSAWELCYTKLKKGDEYHSFGVYPLQEERFHLFWKRDHKRREKMGFKGKILFNQGTDKETLINRNNYRGCEARYMPINIKTPAWFVVYKDITNISLQTRTFDKHGIITKKPLSIVILNQEIADTFEAYFQNLWKKSKPFKP